MHLGLDILCSTKAEEPLVKDNVVEVSKYDALRACVELRSDLDAFNHTIAAREGMLCGFENLREIGSVIKAFGVQESVQTMYKHDLMQVSASFCGEGEMDGDKVLEELDASYEALTPKIEETTVEMIDSASALVGASFDRAGIVAKAIAGELKDSEEIAEPKDLHAGLAARILVVGQTPECIDKLNAAFVAAKTDVEFVEAANSELSALNERIGDSGFAASINGSVVAITRNDKFQPLAKMSAEDLEMTKESVVVLGKQLMPLLENRDAFDAACKKVCDLFKEADSVAEGEEAPEAKEGDAPEAKEGDAPEAKEGEEAPVKDEKTIMSQSVLASSMTTLAAMSTYVMSELAICELKMLGESFEAPTAAEGDEPVAKEGEEDPAKEPEKKDDDAEKLDTEDSDADKDAKTDDGEPKDSDEGSEG